MKTTFAIKALELEAKFKKAAKGVILDNKKCWRIVDLKATWEENPHLGCQEISDRLDKIIGK